MQSQLLDIENKIQLSKEEIIMGFVASCIEDGATVLGLDYLEVYQRMNAVKMIDEYIIPSYEVLHSESPQHNSVAAHRMYRRVNFRDIECFVEGSS